MIRPAFPDGHFYSPVIDPGEIEVGRDRIWPDEPANTFGVDFRCDEQRRLLLALSATARDFRYPVRPSSDASEFHEANGKFEGLDARIYFCLLRHFRPSRVIEVGSGYSSLLAADVNERFLGSTVKITCIEPYPPAFLRSGVRGIDAVREEKVQRLPIEFFETLGANDILFIDSSHVVKTGSDAVFLHLEVLPRLRSGVLVHIHDIFLPADYPSDWVLREQRSWNEQYLVQALLTFSTAFEVVFGSNFAALRLSREIEDVFGGRYGGGSLWIRKRI